MISKITKGKGFAGTLRYDQGKDGARVIDSSLAGQDPAAQAQEMRAVADQNPGCKRPVFHASLSAPPGEKLTDEQWTKIGRDYLKGMGFEGNQFVITRHADTDHDHVHIVANRVSPGSLHVVSDKQDFSRSQDVCRQIEAKHGLTVTPSHGREAAQGKGKQDAHSGLLASMRSKISLAARESGGDFDKFAAGCKRHGIGVKLNQSRATGNVTGISFSDLGGGKTFKGSELGRGFSWKGISSKLGKSRQLGGYTKNLKPSTGGDAGSGSSGAIKKMINKSAGGKAKVTAFAGAVAREMRKIGVKDFQSE